MRRICLALSLAAVSATSDAAAQRTARDSAARVTALLNDVRTQLTIYETQAHRRIAEFNDADTLRSLQQLLDQRTFPEYRPLTDPTPNDLFWAITAILSTTREVPLAVAGDAAYRAAAAAADSAYALAPRDPRTVRALIGVLLSRDRWAEVERIAQIHTESVRHDPWGWMALGLSLARQLRMGEARAAFDEAIARLSNEEWLRLDRIERILAPRAARDLARTDSATRARTAESTWFLADPLWMSDDEQPRLEFLARVAYAELRWWEPEDGARGADTDRGRIHVRYGPPATIARLDYRPPDGAAGRMSASGITIFWIYDSGLVFAFSANQRYARQRLAFDDANVVQSIIAREPARWDNIARRRIDSLPVQLVRFRAGLDSTELFVAARAPLARLTEVRGSELAARTWLIGSSTPDMSGSPLRVAPDGLAVWTSTVAAGEYLWRAEIVTVGEATAARASTPVVLTDDPLTGYLRRGFGMSDVLVGTSTGEPGDAARWREAKVLPVTGPLTAREAVALVWETYDLAPRDGRTRYTVTVTLARERRGTGELGATVVGALASTAGVERQRDAVTITYDREAAHRAVMVDQLTLNLSATPPGAYRLRVEVRDRATGRATVRETGVELR